MTPSASDSAARFVQARDFLLNARTNYAAAWRDFAWPRLGEFNWAIDYFDVMAAGNESPALWIVDESGREEQLSFAQLSARSNRVANWLRELGVARGDRVLLMLGNEPALWECTLAAMKLGAVVIPASTLLMHAELLDRLERGEVRHVIAGADHCSKFEALPGRFTRIAVGAAVPGWRSLDSASIASCKFTADGVTQADDPLLLYFTSGTTSRPKLVLHSHQSYPVGHLSTMFWIGLRPGDVHLNISSPGWAKHAWSCFFAPWNAGTCVFILNTARFSAPKLLEVLQNYGVTVMCAPPTVWRMLIQADLNAWKVQLRELLSAGEPLNPEIIAQVHAAWGITVRDGFGQTETTCQIGNSPGQKIKPGSMGRPLPGYRVELLDTDGKPADDGEVCLSLAPRPLGLMIEYANDTGKMAEVMRDGYYHTGDVARRDTEGYITYIGRADDVFKASDYRISPFELESVLIEHPAVAEAAVVPSPDPIRLAVPKAFLVLAASYTPDAKLAGDIFRFCRQRLAPYQKIRRLQFAELPKTVSGKIRRGELRAREAARGDIGVRGELEFFETDFTS